MRLEARDISFKYGEGTRQILNHVTLTVEAGEKVGIMAPSGYGKTTLCKILAGYEKPDQGEVLLDGTPIRAFRGYSPVQMVWQHPELSVNPKRRLRTVTAEGDWSFEDTGERARIEAELGIRDEWKERFPVEVSGGELQRFCIARALGRRTKLLIADEMTTMLDLITHDLELALLTADRVIVLYGGRVVEETDAAAFQDEKNLKHPYTKALFRSMPKNWEKDGEQLCDTGEILDTMRKEYGR